MSTPADLLVRDVLKVFFAGTPNEVKALDGLSLEACPGDFITIIGSNGAGKSTLLNAVAGTFHVNRGQIRLDDREITSMAEHERARHIGRVFQDPRAGTAPSMTIEQNLCLALLRDRPRRLGWGVTAARRRLIKEQLCLLGMGLEERPAAQVAKLSGGQRQALSLLMATICEPRLLLLDEHTAALDPKVAASVMDLTAHIVAEKGLTTMMVTHNMELALAQGNRLIMMHAGKIIFDVAGAEKVSLTVPDLVRKFHDAAGEALAVDRMLLE